MIKNGRDHLVLKSSLPSCYAVILPLICVIKFTIPWTISSLWKHYCNWYTYIFSGWPFQKNFFCLSLQSDEDCCNSCEEVREAYRKKGWGMSNPDLIDQVFHSELSLKSDLLIKFNNEKNLSIWCIVFMNSKLSLKLCSRVVKDDASS